MSERHQGKIPTDPRLQEMIIGESVRRYYRELEEQRLHVETSDGIEIDATMPEDSDEATNIIDITVWRELKRSGRG
jgi:hypothetical protein